MKTRAELEADVFKLIAEVKPELKSLNLNSDHFDKYSKKLDKLSGRQIRLLITWLIKLKNQLKAYWHIRQQLPESVWTMYDLHGDCEDFREVILLRKSKVTIRELLAARPKLKMGDSNGYA